MVKVNFDAIEAHPLFNKKDAIKIKEKHGFRDIPLVGILKLTSFDDVLWLMEEPENFRENDRQFIAEFMSKIMHGLVQAEIPSNDEEASAGRARYYHGLGRYRAAAYYAAEAFAFERMDSTLSSSEFEELLGNERIRQRNIFIRCFG